MRVCQLIFWFCSKSLNHHHTYTASYIYSAVIPGGDQHKNTVYPERTAIQPTASCTRPGLSNVEQNKDEKDLVYNASLERRERKMSKIQAENKIDVALKPHCIQRGLWQCCASGKSSSHCFFYLSFIGGIGPFLIFSKRFSQCFYYLFIILQLQNKI